MFNEITISGYKGLETSYDLSPLTAIVGDMTSGKSAVLEALTLAVLGKLDVPEAAFIEALSGGNTSIQATGDGVVGTYSVPWNGTSPQPRKAAHDVEGFVPEHALVGHTLRDLVNGGTKLEAAILSRFGVGDLVLPEIVHDVVAENWPSASPDTPVFSVQGAGDFITWAKAEAARLGREIGKANRNAEAVAPGATDGAELLKVEKALKRIDDAVAQHGDKWVRAFVTDEHKKKMKAYLGKERAASAEADKLRTQLAVQEALFRAAKAAVDGGEASYDCPVCGEGTIDAEDEKAKRAKKVAVLKTKLATAQGAAASAKRKRLEVLESAKPDDVALRAHYRALAGSKDAAARQATYQQEAIELGRAQREIQDAAKAVKSALEQSRTAALTQAGLRIDELSFPGFSMSIRAKGPQFVVQTAAGPKFGGLSGGQRGALMLACPLVFASPEAPPLVLLDDEDLAGFSAKGVRELLGHYAELVEKGDVAQVVVTHHSDRVKEIPKSYAIVKI